MRQVEEELFRATKESICYSNLLNQQWWTITFWADDRSIVIKKAGKLSFVVAWDRTENLVEENKQLSDKVVYQEVLYKK